MTEKEFMQKLADSLKGVPSRINIPMLRQYTPALAQTRAERFSKFMADKDGRFASKSDRVIQSDRTLYRLAQNARLEVSHASGNLRFITGLNPMENLFSKMESKDVLIRNMEETAKKINLQQYAAKGEEIKFERLWQVKAASVDQKGKTTEPVLCRSIGAYRHHIANIPVLGAASATVKLAGNNEIDAISIGVREVTEQSFGTEAVSRADDGAKLLYAQLAGLMGKSKIAPHEIATPQWVRFGYLIQSRRQTQRMMIPVFMAAIDVQAEDIKQGYVLTVAATSNQLLAPSLIGANLPSDLNSRVLK